MHRLLVTSEALSCERVTLPKEAAKHLKVLRPKPGEEIELFDGCGATRTYRYDQDALCAAGAVMMHDRSNVELTLFACVTKGSRWDWTIEKSVELGVSRIVPVISDRSIVRLDKAERPAKAERWRRIAEDAARQSDAVWLPRVLEAVDFKDSLSLVKDCDDVFIGALTNPPPEHLLKVAGKSVRAITDKCEAEKSMTEPCHSKISLGLFVGPEGDFTAEELSALLQIAKPASFGPTILRAETAAIFGMSVLSAVAASIKSMRTVLMSVVVFLMMLCVGPVVASPAHEAMRREIAELQKKPAVFKLPEYLPADKDFADVCAKAGEQKKKVFVSIGREMCGRCQRFYEMVRRGVIAIDTNAYEFVRLDIDNMEHREYFMNTFAPKDNKLPFVGVTDEDRSESTPCLSGAPSATAYQSLLQSSR